MKNYDLNITTITVRNKILNCRIVMGFSVLCFYIRGDLEGKVANSLYLCEMKLAKLLAGWLAPLRTVAFASRHEPCSTLELIAGFKSYKQLAADSQNRLCLQIPYPWYSSVAEKCSSPTILSFSTRTQVVDL